MKKFKYIVTVILFVSIFSVSFAFTPYRIEPLDIRAEGMGSAYLTDSESFYTLFSNPAGLAFVGSKILFPTFVSINGDFAYSEKAIEEQKDSADLINIVSAPLTFGAIKNNFGWGVLNTFLLSSGTPLGTDLAVVFGYSLPIDLGFFGTLAIGFSGRGIVQAKSDYVPLLLQLFQLYDNFKKSTTLGFGFDIGIQYEVLNVINIAVVLQDAYTAVWTKNILETKDEGSAKIVSHETPFKYAQVEPKLGIGIGFDFPIEKITEKISHLGIYIDYNNLWPLLKKEGVYRNPLLELSVGAELVLLNVFAFRLGMRELYPVIGLGLILHDFKIDFFMYGRGLDDWPRQSSRMDIGMSMTVQI